MSLKDLFSNIVGAESAEVIVEPHLTGSKMEIALAIVDADVANSEKDVANAIGDVDLTLGSVDELENKIADLADASAGMENMLSGGTAFNAGLFAHHYKTAVRITSRFGGRVQHQGVENFEDKDNFSAEILSGMESFKEIGKKAVAKAKQLFIELYNGFLNLFDGLIKGYGTLGKQAKALHDQIGNDMVFPSTIELPTACNYVDSKGEGQNVLDMVVGLANGLKSMANTTHPDDAKKHVDYAMNNMGLVGKKSIIEHTNTSDTYKVDFNNAHFKFTQPRTKDDLGTLSLFDIGADDQRQSVSSLKPSELKMLAKKTEALCGHLARIDLSRKGLSSIRDHAIFMVDKGVADAHILKDLHKGMLKMCRGASEVAVKTIKGQLSFIRTHLQAAESKAD